MRIDKIFKLSFNMLLHSKLRSWLTIIGIFIGVAAVVAIISLGQGLQQNVSSQISGLGQDIITISSGSARAFGGGEGGGRSVTNPQPLSDRDIDAIRLAPGVSYIDGIISGRATMTFQSKNTSVSVQGNDPSTFKDFITASLASGRLLGPGDSRVVVIGSSVASNVFGTQISPGYLITLNNKPFRVVGVLASSSGFGGSDNAVYMPTKDARDVLNNTLTLAPNEYSSIQVKVSNVQYINETSTNIESALINSHHVAQSREDFSITSAQALQQRFSTVTSGITLFLGVIAAVSLLVGGIGVANTMFTSVLEKTRDIGVMKAIGAKNRDILLIFLINSGLLGLVGGLLGIFFAALISFIVPYLSLSIGLPGTRGGFAIPLRPELLIGAVVFSVIIGMVFGAIPAYRASKLKPVEALRYE